MTMGGRTRQKKLVGVDAGRLLRRAAQELDAVGKHNARIVEVDGAGEDELGMRDVFYIEERLVDGTWRARSIEDIEGQGVLDVRRDLQENLEPAMRVEMIGKLIRSGHFYEAEPARRYVCDRCVFRVAARVTPGG